MEPPATITSDYSQNLLLCAADFVLQHSEAKLPDLHTIVVFIPHHGACDAFRQALLQLADSKGYSAIIPPWVGTLKDWITQHIFTDNTCSIIDEQSRRMLFIDSLKDYPDLFREENKWQVSIALLALFDELTLQQTPVADAETWLQFIQQAYGLATHSHCNREADIVYSLWQAWHQQLDASQLMDSCGDYVNRLHTACKQLAENTFPHDRLFYCLGDMNLACTEQAFIEQLKNHQSCIQINHALNGCAQPTAYSYFIEQCFAADTATSGKDSLFQRINAVKQQAPESIPLHCFPVPDAETQVQAIDLQVRLWLLEKKQDIGIICEDRKLARRLRALLERADIPMQDLSGWSLATTQAASIIERWLQCIEEDFDSRPLLDCLKSPWLQNGFNDLPGRQHEDSQNKKSPASKDLSADSPSIEEHFNYLIYRFEHDIILHENINSNLDRYRQHLALRRKRLSHWPTDSYQQLRFILNRIESIAAPLVELYQARQPQPASQYFAALMQCLDALGISHGYTQDAAGLRILQTLDEIQASSRYANPVFSWQDFRFCLGNALEENLFRPQTQNSSVQLMTLEQAELLHFDGLIIAAAEPRHFPGKAKNTPFFNQAVRQALGLSCWQQERARRFETFKQALFAATEILITAQAEEDGEAIPVSPWMELLMQFHQQVYGYKPLATELARLVQIKPENFCCDTKQLPEQPEQPRPSINTKLLPERFSASSHQRLIDCPYLFFCSDALKLKPLEAISTELGKADYGERIHRILQLFHQPHQNGNTETKSQDNFNNEDRHWRAEQRLENISRQVFAEDLEDNILHRSWLQRWLKHIPAYIAWQMEQQKHWHVDKTEQQQQTSLEKNYILYGRLDRIDRENAEQGEKYRIIDYKTGRSASQSQIESGEDVQLSSYALLEKQASEVMYLSLDAPDFTIKPGARLQEDVLDDYRQQTRQRLVSMIEAISQQQPLPAWGDAKVCQYCSFSGLCRRQQWQG